jgi:hypothetical protein
MAKGLTRATRRAVLKRLKATSEITTIVGEAIYSMAAPDNVQWPFIKMGAMSSVPRRAACLDGSDFRLTVHAFAKGTLEETGEDHCSRLMAAIERNLDGVKLPLEDSALPEFAEGSQLALSLIGSQLLLDRGEADAFHAVIDFRALANA